MKTSYSLSEDQFHALRNYWDGNTTTSSPFNSLQRTGISEEQKRYFKEIGLLDQNYHLTKETKEILKILSLPSLKYIIGYIDAKTNFKLYLYRGTEYGEKCVIISRGDTLTLFYPCITDEIYGHVNNPDFFPLITAPGISLSLSLAPTDAAIMAVLIDIQRQSLSGQDQNERRTEEMKAITFNSYEIFEILRNYEKNPLKWPIISLFFEDIPFDIIKDEDVRKALSRFFAQGYLFRSGEGYILDPSLLSLAQNLVYTTFILFISAIEPGKRQAVHEVKQNIFGGSRSILRISTQSSAGGVISMDTLSSESVGNLIRQIIEDPNSQFGEILPDYTSVKKGADTTSAAPVKTCPSCGTTLSENAKFCRTCGASLGGAIETKPPAIPQCPQCGNPVRKGAKFCPKCGKKLL